MSNENFWRALKSLGDGIRTISDELWKVWRWFGVSFIAFAAYDHGAGPSAFAFGIALAAIGVLSLGGGLFSVLIGSQTEKARNGGKWSTILSATFLFFLALFFAIYIWAITAVIAYPVFL